MRQDRLLILDRHTYWVMGEKNIELRRRSGVLVAIVVDQNRFPLFKSFFPSEPADQIPVVVVPSDVIGQFAAQFNPSNVCWIVSRDEDYSHAVDHNHLVIHLNPRYCKQGVVCEEALKRFDARYLAPQSVKRKLLVAVDIDETLCFYLASKNAGFIVWNHHVLEKVSLFIQKYQSRYDIELIVLTARLSDDQLFERSSSPFLATKYVHSLLRELLNLHPDITDPVVHHIPRHDRNSPGAKSEFLRSLCAADVIAVLFDDNPDVWGYSVCSQDHHLMPVCTENLDDIYLFPLDQLASIIDILGPKNSVNALPFADVTHSQTASTGFFGHRFARVTEKSKNGCFCTMV